MPLWFFLDIVAVLWIAAVYFKTVICLGRGSCKAMWLNIEFLWDVTACRRGNSHHLSYRCSLESSAM
jgi:hypothetical protein